MEKSILEIDLQRARKRLALHEEIMKDLDVKIKYADSKGLGAMRKAAWDHKNRVAKAILEVKNLISDLEKASGALPLK